MIVLVISILLFLIGILVFDPFTTSISDKKNYKLLGLSIYMSICIVAISVYYNYNNEQFLTNNDNTNTTRNKLILHSNDRKTYDIRINDLSEYDYKTKAEIYDMRKQYVNEYKQFVNNDYSPDERYLQVVDGKPWWGTEGIVCKGQGKHSNKGLSRDSAYANNPFVLLNIGLSRCVNNELYKPDCTDEWPTITSVKIQPSKRTITVHYDITSFLEQRAGSLLAQSMKSYDWLEFGTINARDFGYTYANASETRNIRFAQNPNVSTDLFTLNNYWCLGQSCKLPGGCNNVCGPNEGYAFFVDRYPAYAKFKLFKRRPMFIDSRPDLWYEIYLD